MIDQACPVPVTSLEEVQDRFAAWRRQPRRARRIPAELWDAAVSLCDQYSVCQVSRALHLDYKGLRSRYHGSKVPQSPPPFVELAPLWSQGEVSVECDDGHHRQLRIRCQGSVDPRLVDLVRIFFEGRR